MSWLVDWQEASNAFCALARQRGILKRIPHGGHGPAGEALTVDVALLGSTEASRCVVVSSGLHGLEGIAGSAIQRAWLARTSAPPARVVLLHALNPFGFAWQRRVDAENVDPNRNFLLPGEEFSGAPPNWEHVTSWLAPQRPPSRWDPLLPHAMLAVARIGRKQVMQAVSGGQYRAPRGLFYGGSQPAALQALLAEHLPRWTGAAQEILHIDLHTGLGKRGELQLLLPRHEGTPQADALVRRFGPDALPARDEARYYRVRGGLGPWCEALAAGQSYTLCGAEFGTRSALGILAALHQENRAWFWDTRDSSRAKWARVRLVRAFAPTSPRWRQRVLNRGVLLIDQALAP